MAKTGQECPYPGCANEPRPGPPRSRGCAEPGYRELPDPVTGEPTALRPSGPVSSGRAAAQQERASSPRQARRG